MLIHTPPRQAAVREASNKKVLRSSKQDQTSNTALQGKTSSFESCLVCLFLVGWVFTFQLKRQNKDIKDRALILEVVDEACPQSCVIQSFSLLLNNAPAWSGSAPDRSRVFIEISDQKTRQQTQDSQQPRATNPLRKNPSRNMLQPSSPNSSEFISRHCAGVFIFAA